jgi:hypothetical protein
LGVGLTTLHCKKNCYKKHKRASDLDGSLMTVLRDLARYKLDLVEVQEVRWEGGDIKPGGEYTFFYGKGNKNHELGTAFCA